MKIISSWNHAASGEPVAFAFGAFDGIHLGHQYLIAQLKNFAREKGLQTALLAFSNHPQEVLFPGKQVPRITSGPMRRKVLEEAGLDTLLELPFTKETAHQEPEEFVARIVSIVPVKIWVAGEDVAFGRGRRGDKAVLELLAMKYGFRTEFLSKRPGPSSRVIRTHILEGNLQQAEALLGRPFSIAAERTDGSTVYVEGQCLPPAGVWKVQVRPWGSEEWQKATLNIDPKGVVATLDCKVESQTLEIQFLN